MSWNLLDACAFVSMAALSVTAICALSVLIPRLPGSRRGYVFWEAIAEFPAARHYSDDLSTLSAATLAQQKAEHCHELAIVCRRKYQWLRWTSQILLVSLLCSVVILLSGLPRSSVPPLESAKPISSVPKATDMAHSPEAPK
jgi:hypothetical protein